MTNEERDSIGEGLERSEGLIQELERTIEACRNYGIPNPHITYPDLFEVVTGVLQQQQGLLVLLDYRVTELEERVR